MKTIIVFYSLDGNTKYIAEAIAARIGADILELKTQKEKSGGTFSTYFWGGKSAIMGEKPKLQPYQFDAASYDMVILGTPIWAGRNTPPLNTFLSEHDLSGKPIAVFTCSAGGDADKCYSRLRKNLNIVATVSLKDPLKNKEEAEKKIDEFLEVLIR
jgi:flavodoxin